MIQVDALLKRMSNQKINYDSLLRKMIKEWEKSDIRPRILMHSCCAPCSTYTLEFLTQHADVSIYFANSNIHPKVEYERRARVQKQFVEDFNRNTNQHVQFIEAPYMPQDFIKGVLENNLQEAPEGKERCSFCFEMRLDLVAKEAAKLGFDYFGSALTISPKKNSQQINEIGIEVQQLYDVNYLPSDFKKQGGTLRSIEMCQEYDIYRQCYCGCIFAANQQGVDLKKVAQEAKNS